MQNLLSHDAAALRILLTEDIYRIEPEDHGAVAEEIAFKPMEAAGPVADAPAEKYTDFTYLGENNKYFLVLVDDKSHKDLNAVHLEMLLKVMQAKNLKLRDLAILNINRYPGVNFAELKDFFACNRLLLFGIPPAAILLPPIGSNTAESFGNVKILASYSLEEMENDKNKKIQFWSVMKSF